VSYPRFVLANLLRNKRRTILTVLSLAASVFLISTLEGILQYAEGLSIATGSERRLIVRRRTSLQDRLPESYVDKIRALPDVEAATPMTWFGGAYKDPADPTYMFGQLSCDPDVFPKVVPEADVVDPVTGAARPELYDDFRGDRTGAIAARELFLKYDWKLGDKITLQGTIYPVDLELTLRAAYHAKHGTDNQTLYYHQTYLDELLGRPGLIGVVSLRATTVEAMPRLIDAIDSKFANSDYETLTETERAFQAGFLQMMGNIQFLLRGIATGVAFAMLLVAANTTAMAARERAHEIAVLKAIGFTPGKVLTLLMFEAVLLGALGAGLGGAAAFAASPALDALFQMSMFSFFLAGYRLELWIPLAATVLGALVGWVSAFVPSWHVARLPIAATIRRTA
jgi:putative ABC transport system permease protein